MYIALRYLFPVMVTTKVRICIGFKVMLKASPCGGVGMVVSLGP